ncbi:MarR family winged helix-turn-helix transcriptional regulator [Streptomyces solaniscabiei]|uniref:MarR family winged helix-turn-helix transcriptional regulator n=1 Tax=Streptomyces solaniscabiei TaxID=2683255 RepID=UPI001CE29929|nr:MarR family transcriptional regulator [Streptomyces solaniscabiei]
MLWEEVADLILIIAREIQFQGYGDNGVHSLTPSEGMVMRHLHSQPASRPNRIAAAVGLQRTNLSSVLSGLERKGLIERHVDAGDKRSVTIEVTDLGRSNYALVRRAWGQMVRRAADRQGVGARSDIAAALELLRRVESGLTAHRIGAD